MRGWDGGRPEESGSSSSSSTSSTSEESFGEMGLSAAEEARAQNIFRASKYQPWLQESNFSFASTPQEGKATKNFNSHVGILCT